jgi:hypothetical protein
MRHRHLSRCFTDNSAAGGLGIGIGDAARDQPGGGDDSIGDGARDDGEGAGAAGGLAEWVGPAVAGWDVGHYRSRDRSWDRSPTVSDRTHCVAPVSQDTHCVAYSVATLSYSRANHRRLSWQQMFGNRTLS